MSAQRRKLCTCLGDGVCEGAWFCYVVCLALPVLMMAAVLVGGAVLLVMP